MNWEVWAKIEQILLDNDVRPILAVVPDNQDPKLVVDPPMEDFWARVREWQARGWTIALHGWQHVYVNNDPGLMRLTPNSEFCRLPYDEQRRKIQCGLEVFAKEGVRADCWVAPSHSFDNTTLKVLAELGLNVVSDGLSRWPHADNGGITWIPQQLWRLRPVVHAGYWTVCHHHNKWTPEDTAVFAEQVGLLKDDMAGIAEILESPIRHGMSFSEWQWAAWELHWTHGWRPRYVAFKHAIKRILFPNRK